MTIVIDVGEDQRVSAKKIIMRALGRVGVTTPSEQPSAEDAQFAFDALNEMISGWVVNGLLIPSIQRLPLTLIPGQSEYTIGFNGDVAVVPNPVSIRQGLSLRMSDEVDFTVSPVTDGQFASILYKSTRGRPEVFYYSEAGTITFYPVPDAPYTLSIPVDRTLSRFEAYDQEIVVPPGYERALSWSLTEYIMGDFGRDLPRAMMMAKRFRDAVKRRKVDNTFWSAVPETRWNILNNAY